MATIIKKATYSTELNADTTEWCPIDDYFDLFVCGTYQLEEENSGNSNLRSNIRKGCLYLFKFYDTPSCLNLLQKIFMPGILDCKWCHIKLQGCIYLALANAVGEVRILELLENEDKVYLKEIQQISLTSNQGTLILSLDWSTGISNSNVNIIVSTSAGTVAILSYQNGYFHEYKNWNLHNYEAWIVAFNYWDINMFFSGGDDCKLKCFDVRVGRAINTNGSHNAGVTSLHMNFKKEHMLISGSYDENVLFWDIRNMNKPINRINVGGGIWRLKWEPKMCEKICASCMHYGSVVINAVNNTIIAEYKEHQSINYGIDWSFLSEDRICQNFNTDKSDNYSYKILTVCSFYDNLLSLALLQVPE